MPAVESPYAAGGIVLALLTVVGVFLRLVGPWRKQISEAEERLRAELFASLEAERNAHAEDLERERLARAAEARAFALERDDLGDRVASLERKLSRQEARHAAERALDRHRLNNLAQCLDALMLLIETSPERATEIVGKIKEMRAIQIKAEAEEKAIIRAVEIEAAENDK